MDWADERWFHSGRSQRGDTSPMFRGRGRGLPVTSPGRHVGADPLPTLKKDKGDTPTSPFSDFRIPG